MRKFNITVNGTAYKVEVEEVKADGQAVQTPLQAAPQPKAAPAPKKAAPAPAAPVANGTKINAPMPGTILSVKAQNGAQVKKGEVLLVLEAMKMENEIVAPQDGKVLQVNAVKGATVNTGDVLVVLG